MNPLQIKIKITNKSKMKSTALRPLNPNLNPNLNLTHNTSRA